MCKKTHTHHHRKPKSLGGKSITINVILVPQNKHNAWHLLFDNHTPEMIAKIINQTWLDPMYEMVAVPKLKRMK